jgi:hypothetical protein
MPGSLWAAERRVGQWEDVFLILRTKKRGAKLRSAIALTQRTLGYHQVISEIDLCDRVTGTVTRVNRNSNGFSQIAAACIPH